MIGFVTLPFIHCRVGGQCRGATHKKKTHIMMAVVSRLWTCLCDNGEYHTSTDEYDCSPCMLTYSLPRARESPLIIKLWPEHPSFPMFLETILWKISQLYDTAAHEHITCVIKVKSYPPFRRARQQQSSCSHVRLILLRLLRLVATFRDTEQYLWLALEVRMNKELCAATQPIRLVALQLKQFSHCACDLVSFGLTFSNVRLLLDLRFSYLPNICVVKWLVRSIDTHRTEQCTLRLVMECEEPVSDDLIKVDLGLTEHPILISGNIASAYFSAHSLLCSGIILTTPVEDEA